MKKVLLATLGILALASGSALAAELGPPPVYKAPPPPPPSWTGCYLNAGGGYGMWNSKIHEETFPGLVPVVSETNVGGVGWLGVAGGGCDYQFRAFNNWDVVVGAFGDFDWMDLHGVATDSTGNGGDAALHSAWAGGVRAGVLITPTLLAYVNGGYTGTRLGQVNLAIQNVIPPVPLGIDIPAHNFNGWFFGGGTEYALTWSWLPITGLFWRNEYRFSSYQSTFLPEFHTATGMPTGFGEHLANNYVQTITSSLVWRFNWTGH